MEEVKVTKEVVTGYRAVDGEFFTTEQACRDYEETAKVTLYNDIKEYIVKKGTWYDINDDLTDDCDLWVINIANAKVRDKVNMWINMQEYNPANSPNTIKEEHIGKQIVLFANYDNENFWTYGTIDEYHAMLKDRFEKWINPPQTEQK